MPGKPSRPPLGGINIGVSAYSKHQDSAFDAAECIASDKHQVDRGGEGRPAADHRVALRQPRRSRRRTRSRTLLRQSINDGAPRPVTPAYSDISLAIQKTSTRRTASTRTAIDRSKLRDRLEKAAEGKIF